MRKIFHCILLIGLLYGFLTGCHGKDGAVSSLSDNSDETYGDNVGQSATKTFTISGIEYQLFAPDDFVEKFASIYEKKHLQWRDQSNFYDIEDYVLFHSSIQDDGGQITIDRLNDTSQVVFQCGSPIRSIHMIEKGVVLAEVILETHYEAVETSYICIDFVKRSISPYLDGQVFVHSANEDYYWYSGHFLKSIWDGVSDGPEYRNIYCLIHDDELVAENVLLNPYNGIQFGNGYMYYQTPDDTKLQCVDLANSETRIAFDFHSSSEMYDIKEDMLIFYKDDWNVVDISGGTHHKINADYDHRIDVDREGLYIVNNVSLFYYAFSGDRELLLPDFDPVGFYVVGNAVYYLEKNTGQYCRTVLHTEEK